MKLIATHDSTSGEKPANLLSWLVIPFSRTQSKTISEQYMAGCRHFDIRIKKYHGEYRSGHGLYTTKRTLESFLGQINAFGSFSKCYIDVAYEGWLTTEKEQAEFVAYIQKLKWKYTNIYWGDVIVKYTNKDLVVDWVTISKGVNMKVRDYFLGLSGKNWQSYIPIPWLWKKVYFDKPEFNETVFTRVDFL